MSRRVGPCVKGADADNSVVLPARSPNLSAYAERFGESAKSECLDRMMLLGPGHLRTAIQEFVPKALIGTGQVTCRERLGGLLKFYHREAHSAWIEFSHTTGTTTENSRKTSGSHPTERCLD